MSHDSRKLASPRLLADGRVCCSHEGALCAACEAHHAVTRDTAATRRASGARTPEAFAPPDPYAAGIEKLRSATR